MFTMLWSELFCIRERSAWPFRSTEIALAVLVLHHFMFSNRTVYLINQVLITLSGWLTQPILDMLWSEPFCVRKVIAQSFRPREIAALPFFVLHNFTFSNGTVCVTKPAVITSVGGLSQPILNMRWSEPFCIRETYAWPFKPTEIALAVLVLHHLTCGERDKSCLYRFGRLHIAADTWYALGQCLSMYVKRMHNHSTDPTPFLPFYFCTIYNVLERSRVLRYKTCCNRFGRQVVAAYTWYAVVRAVLCT